MLHPERQVDVILNMDASSDVQKDMFQQRVQQIGCRRGLNFQKRRDIKPKEDPKDPDRFQGLYAQIYDGMPAARPETVVDSYGHTVQNPPAAVVNREVTMVYLPLLPNERAVPGYDPSTAKFSGSYNLVWTPEQIDMIVNCSIANFRNGEEAIKEALFNAWQRRKWMRENGITTAPSQQTPLGQTQTTQAVSPTQSQSYHPSPRPSQGPPTSSFQGQPTYPTPPPGGPPSTSPGQPTYPAPPQGQPAYPPQGQPAYPPQGQPAYPPQGQPPYPPQGQPAYPPQGEPTYPPQGQPPYPAQPSYQSYTPQAQSPYPPQGQPDYSSQGQSYYPPPPGQP
jgi:cytosolic phospholipase A2